MHRTDRQTDRETNRWLEGMFDHYRPLSLYRESNDAAYALIINKITQSKLETGRVAITGGRHSRHAQSINCICQVAPMCTHV